MRKFLVFTFLEIARITRMLLMRSEDTYKLLFTPGLEEARFMIGKWKAWRVFEYARKNTPAYKKFLHEHGMKTISLAGFDPDLMSIPSIDKENYVKKYSIQSRCLNGVIPKKGVIIDESSGTSGTATNWVRGPRERAEVKKILQLALHNVYQDKPIFIINAFALGPWATGMNVAMSTVDISILKSTGPDIKKIENTLNFFGPSYNYVIMGYPPFLKSLVDSADVTWKDYSLTAIFGGEGMSEGMRSYLGKYFKKLYGSYGASDLEINIAAENDFTIALRQELLQNPELSAKLIKVQNGTPMIFQYNPMDYYIESTTENELLITLCRITNISPKIRYNIHDSGHVLRFSELKHILKECNIPLSRLAKHTVDLPLLFHYGRADMAVAFYGCKITPSEIEQILFEDGKRAKYINSFALLISEDDNVNKHLTLAIEIRPDHDMPNDTELAAEVFDTLKEVNQDYREASHMIPHEYLPTIKFFAYKTGPFANDDIRIKKRYIQTEKPLS